MIEADGQHFNRRWGYLSRAGVNDKSQLMRQIEKCAKLCGDDSRAPGRWPEPAVGLCRA